MLCSEKNSCARAKSVAEGVSPLPFRRDSVRVGALPRAPQKGKRSLREPECGLRRKADAERVKGKAEASNLPHPSTFAFFLFLFALFRLPTGRLHQHLRKNDSVVDKHSKDFGAGGRAVLKPLYSPRPDRPMRVAGFMSGSGTNLVKILDRQAEMERTPEGCPYEVVVIFTDNPSSHAGRIAESRGIPLLLEDIHAFYRSRGHTTKKDISLRPAFDRRILDALTPYRADTIVLAGYMSVVSEPLLAAFPGRIVNVHPADLRILERGRRKYTGGDAVRDALVAGESFLRATTHVVREEVDGGEILMVSAPLRVELPAALQAAGDQWPERRDLWTRVAQEHQERLKRVGDWEILPKTLEWLAQGRYCLDEKGRTCLDGKPLTNPACP